MPPKQKLSKHSHSSAEGHGETSGQSSCRNPHVVLQPFMRDESSRKRYRFTALPAAASLYDKPELSDVCLRLMPTDKLFHAHRVVLSAASDVFATMLSGTWAESKQSQLELHEELDCARVFDRFLYFIYSGNILISDDYVVPLFLLACKYDIRSLYNECAKLIERALKVYIFGNREILSMSSSSSDTSMSESSDMSDLSDADDPQAVKLKWTMPAKRRRQFAVDDSAVLPSGGSTTKSRSMVASETFPVVLVLRLLEHCHGNERVRRAALLNLEARVGNQICLGNFSAIWLDLSVDVIVAMLTDTRFGYPEMRLFEAAVAWLEAQPERAELTGTVLRCVRYVLLSTAELYEVEKRPLVRACDEVAGLVHDAVRHRLFHSYCTDEDRARWTGTQFVPRAIPRS